MWFMIEFQYKLIVRPIKNETILWGFLQQQQQQQREDKVT